MAASACRSSEPAPSANPTLEQRRAELFGAADPQQPAGAADEDVRSLRTVSGFLRHGLLHNAALRSAFESWQAEVEGIDRSGRLPDPRLTFAYFVEEIQTRTGPQESRLSVTQMLPWFGKRQGERDRQSHRADAAWQRARAVQLDLERRLRVEFHEYAFMGKEIELRRDDRRLLVQLLAIADERYATGSAGREDLLRLNVEIGILDDLVIGLEQRRAAMSARLGALLNAPDVGVLEFPVLDLPAVELPDPEVLRAQAERQNPRVLELRAQILEAGEAAAQAARDGYPDLTLGLDYFSTSRASTPVKGSGDDPVAVTLGVNLPLWRGSLAAARREAGRREDSVRLSLTDQLSRLHAEVEWEVYQVKDATRRMALYHDTLIPQMQETLDVLRTSYSAGTAEVDELLEAERVLLTFAVDYWRACKDCWQGEARLIALCGGSVHS